MKKTIMLAIVAMPMVANAQTIIDEKDTQPNGVYWRLPDGRLSTVPPSQVTEPSHQKTFKNLPSLSVDVTGPLGNTLHLGLNAGRLISLHNSARAAANAQPLVEDPELMAFALAHSQEQARSGSKGPFHSNGRYGENVAWTSWKGGSDDDAHRMWMNSPGHKANLLNKKYTKIGYASAIGKNGTYYTAVFK